VQKLDNFIAGVWRLWQRGEIADILDRDSLIDDAEWIKLGVLLTA
jgi:hypothetical protein